eukprot:COSAG02_NODE_213_length_28704_cov_69.390177_7_plen_171_part_00
MCPEFEVCPAEHEVQVQALEPEMWPVEQPIHRELPEFEYIPGWHESHRVLPFSWYPQLQSLHEHAPDAEILPLLHLEQEELLLLEYCPAEQDVHDDAQEDECVPHAHAFSLPSPENTPEPQNAALPAQYAPGAQQWQSHPNTQVTSSEHSPEGQSPIDRGKLPPSAANAC